MSHSQIEHRTEEPRQRLPILAAITSGLVAIGTWARNTSFMQQIAEVRTNTPWHQWAYRWPGSFFEASPYFGKLTDTALAVGATALAFGITERREGMQRTLKLAAASQFLGCAATRTVAVASLVPAEYRSELDVGPSAVTVALGANYLTRRIQEARSVRDVLACKVLLGTSALGLAAGALVDPNITDVAGHAVGFAYGVFEGRHGSQPTTGQQNIPE